MKDFATPPPGLPYLAEASAQQLDQMHDRIQGELQHHQRNAVAWHKGDEPNVELSLDEARIALGNLTRIAHLLRLVSEGEV